MTKEYQRKNGTYPLWWTRDEVSGFPNNWGIVLGSTRRAFTEVPEEYEFGYLPIDTEGARLLFQVIADAYEQRSLIITTNLEFARWGTVFGDDNMAAEVIDRIVHHGRLLQFRGDSYRVKHALMK